MGAERRFCRFSTSPSTAAFALTEIPPDGICLSAFLVVRSAEDPNRILLGRLNPGAPWDHLGALDPERVAHWKDRWMLPASHLIYLESPHEAAERIRRELTGLTPREIEGPRVISEVYAAPRHPSARQHWDLEFIFRAVAEVGEIRPLRAWSRLEFVDPRSLAPADLARSHDDIISGADLETWAPSRLAPPPAGSPPPSRAARPPARSGVRDRGLTSVVRPDRGPRRARRTATEE